MYVGKLERLVIVSVFVAWRSRVGLLIMKELVGWRPRNNRNLWTCSVLGHLV